MFNSNRPDSEFLSFEANCIVFVQDLLVQNGLDHLDLMAGIVESCASIANENNQ